MTKKTIMGKKFLPDDIKVCRGSLQSVLLYALSQNYSATYEERKDLMWQLTPDEVLQAEMVREISENVRVLLLENKPCGGTNYWLVSFTAS